MGKFYADVLDQLTVRVRRLAWLHAKPKGANATRLERFNAEQARGVDRPELVLPHVDAGIYLVDYLMEVGPAVNGEPISFREIEAWCSLTGRVLEPWEATALRRLSGAYLSEAMEASDPMRAAPGFAVRPSRAQVASKLDALLSRWEAQDAKGSR